LITDKPSVLASELWCTVPFDQNPKAPFDELVDILLQLPTCLPCRNEMRNLQEKNPLKSEVLRRYIGSNAKHLLCRLGEFWENNKCEIDPNYDRRREEISSHLAEYEDREKQVVCKHQFQSPSNAYITSMYDAGRVITLGLMGAASLAPNSYDRASIIHGSSILASAEYCEAQGLFNGGSFSMIFPIKLICLLSPSEEQRTLAQSVLSKWASKRGLADSCEVAAPSYFDRSHG
jgi:hypothetical protein